jgi:6-pyruvoyltetrahydropterin/6-carboxytetrahydropterin synthase
MNSCPICNLEFQNAFGADRVVHAHLYEAVAKGCSQHQDAVKDFCSVVDTHLLEGDDIFLVKQLLQQARPSLSLLATDGFLHYRKKFLKESAGNSADWTASQLLDSLWKGVCYRACITKHMKESVEFLAVARYILGQLQKEMYPLCHVCKKAPGEPHSYVMNSHLPSDVAYVCPDCLEAMRGPRISVTRQFHFAAAHYLPEYQGKCANLHGHEWKVELSFERPVNVNTHMVIDYSDIKQLESLSVDALFDHSKLNLTLSNPTAENILLFIWERLMLDYDAKCLSQICVWEAPTSYANLTATDMNTYITTLY